MVPSVLDLYLLSLIDRGLRSRYEWQRHGGVSLGSSSPALLRLHAAKLIRAEKATGDSKRVRQAVQLTVIRRKVVRSEWRRYLDKESTADVEAILRIVDMTGHYGARSAELSAFLKKMAAKRMEAERGRGPRLAQDDDFRTAVGLQQLWASARTRAEASFLLGIAAAQAKKQEPASTTTRSAAKTKRTSS